nr:hypothetical protein [uncultured Bacteroides sp.]
MLNELSQIKVNTRLQVHGIMEYFVLAANEAESTLLLDELRIDEMLGNNLYDLQLMNDYSIGQWIEDENVDGDLKSKFLSIVSTSPLVNREEISRFESENCYYEGQLGAGIKAALFYNTFCINFFIGNYVDKISLPIKHEYISDGELKNDDEIIKCFTTSSDVLKHKDWFLNFQNENLQRSKDLWDKRTEFFPNLILCEAVKSQISRLGKSTNLTNIIERLRALNEVASSWTTGDFNYQQINDSYRLTIHPESTLTLDNYKQCRIFSLPDKRKELFDLHIITGNLRIHFYPDNNEKKIYIGYIGHHLKTWSF